MHVMPGRRATRAASLVLCLVALMLLSVSSAFAASTYFDQSPGVNVVSTQAMPLISVKVSDPAGISTGYQIKVDGVSRTPKVTWGPNKAYCQMNYQQTAALKNGPHSVYASVFTGAGRTSTTWSFTTLVPPAVGPLAPADNAVANTQKPTISATVVPNGVALSTWAMTVDGAAVSASYSAATKTVSYTPSTNLKNDADHDVTLTVTDASGASTSVSWSFSVQIYADMNDTYGCTECHTTYPTDHPMDDCWGCHDGFAPYPAYWNMEDLTPVHGAELLANEDCTYCHSTVFAGVPSHVQDVKGLHVTSDNMSGCACHVRNLTNEHARYTDDAGEQLSCITCHGPDVPQRVKDAMQLPTTPTCADCHDIPLGHPYAEVDHLADVGETADLSGFLCGDCHDVDLMAEHEKVSSSSAGGSCTTCHPTPRDSFDEWNQTCSQGGCHSVGSPQTMHAETTAAHTFPSPTPSCVEGCHSADGDNLATVHLDASVTTPGGEVRTSCMVCHADGVPSTNDCATCHPDRVAEHGYEAAMHTATLGSGGIALFDNHDGWMGATGAYMDCADCHNAELGDTHANLCSTCHPTPRNTFTGWSKNCTQGGCHATYHASGFDHDEIASGNCSACHDEGSFQLYDDPCVDCHAKPSAGDATAPVTTAAALANYNGTARIEFTMTDSGMVGIGTTFRKLDGAAATKGDLLEVSEGGSHSLEYWSVDQYGNEETPHKSLNFTVAPDSTPPVTTSNVKSAYEGPATITLSASDASYLGVKGTYYKLNGGATQTGTLVSIGQPASGTVAYTLEWWSDDYSGNVEGHHTASFTVTRDITPPVSTLSAQPYYKTATVSIPFAAVDTGYGVSQKAYKIDGGTTQFLSSAANNLTRTFTAQGPHTIEYWSIDRGGNTEVHRTATINVDWTVPTVSSNAATTYTETATITITAADLPANGAGLANIVYRVDGGTQQNAPSGAAATDLVVGGAGTHSIEYWALDNAGNSAVHAVKVFTIGGGTPTGNGTIRLVWGDSDVSGYVPLYDSWAAWTVRSGGASGPIVATGRGDAGVDGWDGVDDVTVPVSETPYYVYIDWFDADWWYDGPTIHPSVLVTYPGQVVRLSY